MSKFTKAAASGVALLDEKRPRWRRSVDKKNLRQGDIKKCVLAQVYGNFGAGVAALKVHGRLEEFGFSTSHPPDYRHLTRAWKLQLA